MLNKKLSIEEWRQHVYALVLLVNRQYRQVSESNIELRWLTTTSGCEAILVFPSRGMRIIFESLINEMLQGVCYVLDNTKLRWMYV